MFFTASTAISLQAVGNSQSVCLLLLPCAAFCSQHSHPALLPNTPSLLTSLCVSLLILEDILFHWHALRLESPCISIQVCSLLGVLAFAGTSAWMFCLWSFTQFCFSLISCFSEITYFSSVVLPPGRGDQRAGNQVHVRDSPNSLTRKPTWRLSCLWATSELWWDLIG